MSPWFFSPCLASSTGLFIAARKVHRKHTGRSTSLKDHGVTVHQNNYIAKLFHSLDPTQAQKSPSSRSFTHSKRHSATRLPHGSGPGSHFWCSPARHVICLTSVSMDTVKSVAFALRGPLRSWALDPVPTKPRLMSETC